MQIEDEAFFFTRESNFQKPLTREHLTRSLNKNLEKYCQDTQKMAKFTSHSFRHNFITDLWKKSKDIEFVRQVIGHEKISTTQTYIQELSQQEIKAQLNEY